MVPKAKSFITNPDVLIAYRKMIEAVPDVEMKGKTHPYLSINGNMYSSISKDHIIGLRLSKADCGIYLEKYQTGLFEPFPGFFQKGYVPIPHKMHDDIPTMQSWFKKCYENAITLKPKATKKKKK